MSWLDTACIAAMLLVLWGMVEFVAHMNEYEAERRAACEAKGGTLIKADGYHCVRTL